MPDLRAPRGMSDLLPEDAALWRHVRDTAERVARLFDYQQIATPIVEDAAVFLRTVGDDTDIVAKEMYTFEDRGGGTLALRPEGTAAVCRSFLEHGMASRPQPVRLYYFGPMFRYDRPQAGRYRQLWQFGVECIGDPSPAADVEVIELEHTLHRELGLRGLVLRINSIGSAATRPRYNELLREHFRPHLETLSADSRRRYETNILRILDSKEDAQHPAVLNAPSILDHLDEQDAEHFARVRSLLDDVGIEYEVDPHIVRGLDYYARTVWEFGPPDGGGQSTIGAGGRYDGLMELLGGPPTPGTGFATGIERIVLGMKEQGVETSVPVAETGPDFYLVVASDTAQAEAMKLARHLRTEGQSVVVGDAQRSVRAQMRLADRCNARFSPVIGEREVQSGRLAVRDLVGAARIESEFPFDSPALAIFPSWAQLERAVYRAYRPHGGEPDEDSLENAFRWFFAIGVFNEAEQATIEELRAIRNAFTHAAPTPATSHTSIEGFRHDVAALIGKLESYLPRRARGRITPIGVLTPESSNIASVARVSVGHYRVEWDRGFDNSAYLCQVQLEDAPGAATSSVTTLPGSVEVATFVHGQPADIGFNIVASDG